MTFSIAGRCARTGELGVAISSSSPAVAARCAHTRAGVGAVCTQNVTDPRLGPAVLDALEAGANARDAVDAVASTADFSEFRQLAAVDAQGSVAAFSGTRSMGINGHLLGTECVAAGNLLASEAVLPAMVSAFEADPNAPLEERLLAALEAALGEGGEAGPVSSAGLVVSANVAWPVTSLRVDWSVNPVGDLREALAVWLPQRNDYVVRALDPRTAPAFGVAGEDQ